MMMMTMIHSTRRRNNYLLGTNNIMTIIIIMIRIVCQPRNEDQYDNAEGRCRCCSTTPIITNGGGWISVGIVGMEGKVALGWNRG